MVRVLVASAFLRASCREVCGTAGENATATKHGFESRWGHHIRWSYPTSASSSWPGRPSPAPRTLDGERSKNLLT